MDQDKLVNVIIEARKSQGMNQGQASLHCGFSETYLGMIERRKRLPGPKALLRIMTGLGIREKVMREFLPHEFHNLYEASEPEYPRIRKYLRTHTSSDELEKELLGTSFSSLEGFICEFLFDYWRHALADGLLPPEDWRHRLVTGMIAEVKEAKSGRAFGRMLEILEDEEQGPDGQPFSMLSLLKDWYYDREANEVILKIDLEGVPEKERVYCLKLREKGARAGPVEVRWEDIERVRQRAMGESQFSELPGGLKELIYDQETFHRFRVKEEELKYLKSVELRGTGGQPTKEGFLFELERFRGGGYPSAEDSILLGKGSPATAGLFEIVSKILKTDEGVRETIIQAIRPTVDAIIEVSHSK